MQTNKTRHSFLPWLGWLVVCCAGLYQFMLQTSTSVMIPDLEKAFSLDSLGVSLLSSSFFYTYIICQIPAGMLIDYFKPRRTIFICQLFLAIFCYVFANSTNVWMACISRILMGIVCAPTFIAAFYLIAHTLPEKYFALVAGFTETMAMLGGIAGEALLARCVMHYGWRQSVLILAVTAFSMSILVWIFTRDVAHVESTSSRQKNVFRDVVAMLALPQAWINGLFSGLLFAVIAQFGSFWCIPFLMQLYGIPLGLAADASSMIFIGAAIGSPIVGWLSDRLETRRNLMIVYSFCAAIIFTVITFAAPQSLTWMFVLIFALGFFSAVYLLPFAVIRDITPSHMRGAAMGYINMMCILIGSPILLPLVGFLLHSHVEINLRAYQDAFLIVPISLLAACVLAFFVREE